MKMRLVSGASNRKRCFLARKQGYTNNSREGALPLTFLFSSPSPRIFGNTPPPLFNTNTGGNRVERYGPGR